MTIATVRRRLFDFQKGKCWWCKRRCRLLSAEEMRKLNHALPDDAATVDHMYSRLNPKRQAGKVNPVVMACHRCNQERNREENLALPTEEKWRRSRRPSSSTKEGEVDGPEEAAVHTDTSTS